MKKASTVFIALASVLFLFALVYKLQDDKPTNVEHPQEPKPPYPYYFEDVVFQNIKAGISLSGTLTLPSRTGKFPVVVLITGSGPQDRNEEVNNGHKPFLVIADYLTRRGIAVLRYDDRGTYKSSGNFQMANSLDFSDDVESAVSYLKTRKEIDSGKIGLIGHSEGATIASIVASRSNQIAFLISMAGPGLRGDSLMLIQGEFTGRSLGLTEERIQMIRKMNSGAYKIVLQSQDLETSKSSLSAYALRFKDLLKDDVPPNMTFDQFIGQQVEVITSPWWQFFLRHDPAATYQKVMCPVLVLNGNKDLQVTSKENLPAILSALEIAKNKNVTIKEIAGVNHFFQECETGSAKEYANIEQTFSPLVLKQMTMWIQKQVN
ncbi:alpha/beta hydrolase family protein [Dyadobacter sp. MSC1_007]|jgi:alpha/beta superfamily hydrolase|uniref:alpha/beta hydrolase family protein n=1 Tax=Dyadobacter sp. MSC1_007 TaxID=2909264 RepID=UPI0020308685|nr:CocE/NonD family hydrolase [Dyadobacter sp. MSC1_007]